MSASPRSRLGDSSPFVAALSTFIHGRPQCLSGWNSSAIRSNPFASSTSTRSGRRKRSNRAGHRGSAGGPDVAKAFVRLRKRPVRAGVRGDEHAVVRLGDDRRDGRVRSEDGLDLRIVPRRGEEMEALLLVAQGQRRGSRRRRIQRQGAIGGASGQRDEDDPPHAATDSGARVEVTFRIVSHKSGHRDHPPRIRGQRAEVT